MAVQEKIENTIFDTLFNAYLNNEIAGLQAVSFDDAKEIDAQFEAFEEKLMMNLDAINTLFDLKTEYGALCEKKGFISGVKLGALLLKEMTVSA